MLRKNIFSTVTVLIGGMLALSSCDNNERSPGWEYMPDMYRGPALEAYQPYENGPDNMSALKPVEGTIPRGFASYEAYPHTAEGYESAKAGMMIPGHIGTDSLTLQDGAQLYGIFCAQCHGGKGDGQGILVERQKFLGVPSYADREITLGSIFHVITYGKGMMGSHASQVTPDERWRISRYVMELRQQLTGGGQDTSAVTGAESKSGASGEASENAVNKEESKQSQVQ